MERPNEIVCQNSASPQFNKYVTMFTVTMTTALRIDVFGDHAYFVIHAHPEVPFSTVRLRIFPCALERNCAFKRIHRLTDSISIYEVMHHYLTLKSLNIKVWCEKESNWLLTQVFIFLH